MITERDKIALDFIAQFRLVTADQVNRAAYNNIKVCYKRLQKLADDGIIYREKNTVNMGYVFSTEKIRSVKQFMHDSIRTEFYFKLKQYAIIDEMMIEKVFGTIRPDGLFDVSYYGKDYLLALEVETRGNRSRVNYDKYNNFFFEEWKKYFDTKPIVIYVTDKFIDEDKIEFKYHQLNTNLDNFTSIFK